MKVGLLSDTHSFLDPKIFKHFETCDEVWHAGDVGSEAVLDGLERFKPTRIVYGNIDDKHIRVRTKEHLRFEVEGFRVWMTHIGGVPPGYNSLVKPGLSKDHPDIFICGHSHILRVMRDIKLDNMLYINPGAAGIHGFHKMRTAIRFELLDRKIRNMEVIELGLRGRIDPEIQYEFQT